MNYAVACTHTPQRSPAAPPQVWVPKHRPPPEHAVKRQVQHQALRRCPRVGPTGTVGQHTSAGTKSKSLSFSMAPTGKQGAPAEAPASLCTKRAPSKTAPRSDSCLSALASSQGCLGSRAWGRGGGGMYSGPPSAAVCPLSCLVAQTHHKHQLSLTGHHITLHLWAGFPGDCRNWWFCSWHLSP